MGVVARRPPRPAVMGIVVFKQLCICSCHKLALSCSGAPECGQVASCRDNMKPTEPTAWVRYSTQIQNPRENNVVYCQSCIAPDMLAACVVRSPRRGPVACR